MNAYSLRRKGTPAHEIEANEFASELLLPYKEIQPLVKSKDLTISLAKTLSREFRTSLTATCLKCVEVSDEKCAIVVSVAGAIRWFRRNDHFRYFIRVNQQLSKHSYAAQLFSAKSIEEPSVPFLQKPGWIMMICQGKRGFGKTQFFYHSTTLR